MEITYIGLGLLLILSMPVYFRIADKYDIIDKPNERSSHTQVTLRGGGVVFGLALLFYLAFFPSAWLLNRYVPLVLGMLMISTVSFWDDIKNLPNKVRLSVHLVSVTLLLWGSGAFQAWPAWAWLLAYVLIIGTINAYNFMDGINGMTGAYSLVLFLSAFYINRWQTPFIDPPYIIAGIWACLVFLFFNFRKKAKCFAGDVGSVGAGYWAISILLLLVLATGSFKYVFFLSLYGTDAVLTILHRLWLKQNIFEAHRLHYYQILVNERGFPHRAVSLGYALLQLGINAWIIHTNEGFMVVGLVTCLPPALLYLLTKRRLMQARLA